MHAEQKKTLILDLSLLAFLSLALLAPALFFGTPTFVNDALHDEIPQLAELAGELRAGNLPLWNPHLFTGARPAVYDPIWLYYAPSWPFLMISDIEDPAAFSRTAVLLPYLLHMILAAAGTYVFLRRTLGTGRIGALIAGCLFALSPAFTTAIEAVNQVAPMALLPWLAIIGTAFLKKGGVIRWALLVLLLAVLNSTGSMNILIRCYAVTSLLFFLVWLGLGGKTESWPLRVGRLAGMAGAYVLAMGILGPMWMGVFEAQSMVTSAVSELTTSTSAIVQRFEAEGHTPILHFASMFCPDLFGVITLHGWGVAVEGTVTQLSHVGGGLAAMSIVSYGLIRLFRGVSDAAPVAKAWWRSALGVCVLLMILMMGRHTFLYAPLARIGGFLVDGPHPYYYQFGVCWLLAVLAGLGANELSSIRRRSQRLTLVTLAAGCGLVAVAAAAVSLLSPVTPASLASESIEIVGQLAHGESGILWHNAMRSTGGIGWLLAGPGLYVLLSVLGCAAAAFFCRAKWLPAVALAALVTEYAVLAAIMLYSTTNVWQNKLDFSPKGNRLPKLAHVGELGHFEVAAAVSELAEEHDCRWTMAWSRGDNLSQCFGTRALLGHASRPLIADFHEAARQIYKGFPYQLHIHRGQDDALRQFYENENVGFLLAASGQKVIRFTPVPAIYLQPRVERLDEEGQLAAVTARSFAETCLVLPDAELQWLRTDSHQALSESTEFSLEWSRPHADRIEVRTLSGAPAMMVITECWHPGWQATIDGKTAQVHKVNHHQMAVELPADKNDVVLSFKPRCVTVGCWISLASLLTTLAVCAAMRLTRSPDTRDGSIAS